MTAYYIALDLQPGDEDELMVLLDELVTTRDEEPEMLGRFIINGPMTVHEVAREMFALGACFERIEQEQDIVFPFDFVVLADKPTDVDELDLLFDGRRASMMGPT